MNTVMRYCLLPAIGFLLSSCATLIHQRTVNVKVYSDTDSVEISVGNDTARWYSTPAWINVERSRNDLHIIARKDSIQKQINVKSKLSTAFWLGNMLSGTGIIGYAVDFTNPRRFIYPPNITIDFKSDSASAGNYQERLTPEKGRLVYKISIPEGNHYYLDKRNGYGNHFGFLGISGGLDYYFSDKYCLNMDLGTLTDFTVPYPAPVDFAGSYQRAYAVYGDIQLGSDCQRFHYDVGLQYTKTSYSEREVVEKFPVGIDIVKYSKTQNKIGYAFSTYYRISNGFNLGLNYYPSFLAWDNSGFKMHYAHLIFFELNFRIEAFRPGEN